MRCLPSHQLKPIARWLALALAMCMASAGPLPAMLPVPPAHDEVYRYREVTGAIVKHVKWHLQKGERYTLTYTLAGEKFITIADQNYDTRRWHVITDDGKTDLEAVRNGTIIRVSGRFQGQPVGRRLEIDDGPWYQATSLSLRELVASDATECLFWTIRFNTLTAHKIKAVKKGVEKLESVDNMLRIRLTLPGLLAPFWKSDYWFTLPEGVFFRFQGPSGPPGSPITTVTRAADRSR